MKRLSAILSTILLIGGLFGFAPSCYAENQTLKQACETKAKQAAELIKKLGAKEAFKKITDASGPFVDEKSHVFGINSENGVLLAHKIPMYVGFNMHNYKDADKKAAYTRILEQAKQTASGWMTFMTYGSGLERRETPGLKNMYFLRVSGENIVLCCGYWEDA